MKKTQRYKTSTNTQTKLAKPGIELNELVLGTVVDVDNSGSPLIDYPGNETNLPVLALATVSVDKSAIGRQVAILFASGDSKIPVVIGLIRNYLDINEAQTDQQLLDVKVDNEKLELSAEKEIVLKCGGSSITLTKAGKVIIKGEYVVSMSKGVNSIKGGSIQLN